jgi:lysine 2,3-aminomutase
MTWQKEFSNSIKTREDTSHFFDIALEDSEYPIFIPKNFAKKIKALGPESALWKQFIPTTLEDNKELKGHYDPIGDKIHSKGSQLIHRYINRVLFTPTTVCPVACRYCFRKNELAFTDNIFDPDFLKTLEYLKSNKEINEIIFSGGDPFILSDEKINYYLEEFSKISSIKYIRFHTRTPIIIPGRINEPLINILSKHAKHFSRLMIMIHVNHTEELDNEVQEALLKLKTRQIEVLSQTVLLKNINDNTETLKNLFLKLADLKITPYYLHHPDLVLGGMHFYLSLEEGRKIFAPLHNMIPGWALPQYVIDIPGGEGKTSAINPENFSFSGRLINKDGLTINL